MRNVSRAVLVVAVAATLGLSTAGSASAAGAFKCDGKTHTVASAGGVTTYTPIKAFGGTYPKPGQPPTRGPGYIYQVDQRIGFTVKTSQMICYK